jgi:hypothetical protein
MEKIEIIQDNGFRSWSEECRVVTPETQNLVTPEELDEEGNVIQEAVYKTIPAVYETPEEAKARLVADGVPEAAIVTEPLPDGLTMPKWENGAWIDGYTAPTLADHKNDALADVRQKYAAKMDAVATPYTRTEQMTWDQQEKEARAYQADPAAAVPMLAALAAARGIALADLVGKIIAKADLYAAAIGAILGEQQWREDQIEAIAADGTKTYEEKKIAFDDLVASIPS